MPKNRLLLPSLVILVVFASTLLIAQEEAEDVMCVPMGKMTLEPPESVDAQRSAVGFRHTVHMGLFECRTCHHTWEGDTAIQGCMTSGCHDLEEYPTPKEGEELDESLVAQYYKNAYHGQCIGCHKEIHIKNEKIEEKIWWPWEKRPRVIMPGPTSCSECHPE